MLFKHIAVIRNSAMGDVAISLPLLTAFARQYPDVKITYVTKKIFAPLFSHLPNIEVLTPDWKGKHKGVLGIFRLYKELKSRKIEAVVDIHNVLRTNVLRFFFSLGKIPFLQIDKGRAEKKALTRANNKIFRQLPTSFERYQDVFARLGFPISILENDFVSFPSLSNEVNSMLSHRKNIGIAPFASHVGKQYPFESLKNVIIELSKRYPDSKIFVFGGGSKEKDIVNSLPFLPNVINVIGSLSFSYELQLISRLDVMLAMDSGNAHLSAMYGVPTVTIWGVTHPFAGFYPYKQPISNALLADREQFPLIPTSVYGNKYPKGYENAIKSIKIEQILEKITEILEK